MVCVPPILMGFMAERRQWQGKAQWCMYERGGTWGNILTVPLHPRGNKAVIFFLSDSTPNKAGMGVHYRSSLGLTFYSHPQNCTTCPHCTHK